MSIVLALYLADICDGLNGFFISVVIICTVICIICFISMLLSEDWDDKLNLKCKKALVRAIVVGLITSFIAAFIPSKTTMLTYTGISISQELSAEVHSETYQKLMKVLNIKLDDYIAEQEKK